MRASKQNNERENDMSESKNYMAYNHNGTKLLNKPTTKKLAEKEVEEFSFQTGSYAYVGELVEY